MLNRETDASSYSCFRLNATYDTPRFENLPQPLVFKLQRDQIALLKNKILSQTKNVTSIQLERTAKVNGIRLHLTPKYNEKVIFARLNLFRS